MIKTTQSFLVNATTQGRHLQTAKHQETPMNPRPQKNSSTLKEAADFLKLSERTIERLIARGLIRKSKFCRRVIIPGVDIENLVESTC